MADEYWSTQIRPRWGLAHKDWNNTQSSTDDEGNADGILGGVVYLLLGLDMIPITEAYLR